MIMRAVTFLERESGPTPAGCSYARCVDSMRLQHEGDNNVSFQTDVLDRGRHIRGGYRAMLSKVRDAPNCPLTRARWSVRSPCRQEYM